MNLQHNEYIQLLPGVRSRPMCWHIKNRHRIILLFIPLVLDVWPKCGPSAVRGGGGSYDSSDPPPLATGLYAAPAVKGLKAERRNCQWQICPFDCCRSGNIRKVLIFGNFARRTYSRIQESRENYFYNSATNSKSRKNFKIKNSRKFKHARITRSTASRNKTMCIMLLII